MARYRIKVEALDPSAEELRAELRMGIECEGFVIMADQGDGGCTSIEHMSITKAAELMAGNAEMIKTACVARAIAEGRTYARELSVKGLLRDMLGGRDDDDE